MIFFGNHCWRVYQIWKTILQILIKLLNLLALFSKFQTSFQIQELSLNPEKYFGNPKKYCVTCCLRQQFAIIGGLLHPSGGVLCLVFDLCGSKVNPAQGQILLQMWFQSCRDFTSECKNKYTWRWTCFILFIYKVIITILGLQNGRTQRI